jgi:hypothetical protein
MKSNFQKLLFIAILSLLPLVTISQTISIGSDTAVVGENILIPLSTNGLLNIGSMDIKITYDSTVLIFLKDTLLSPDASGTLMSITSGNGVYKQINISWLTPGSSGVNIANGNFMSFKFNYLGGSSSLNFNQIFCEVLDYNSNLISVLYNNGFVSPSAGANISTWNGNDNWSSLTNWSNGIPGLATSAIVNSGNLEINNIGECNNLTINNGATVYILPNKSLTVNGTFNNNGNIIVKSDTSGSGSFINYGSINGNGNITIEKYLRKSNPNDYSLITSPILNANISSSIFNNTSFQLFNETTQNWQNLLANSVLQQGKGYLINSTSDKKITFSDSTIANSNISFNNLTISNTTGSMIPNGFNLIGNPFASAVDWENSNWTKTNIDASIYTFDGINYVSWNGEIGSFTNGIIPSLQGFFVKVNANNPVLIMPDTARIHNNQAFYKSSDKNINDLLIIKANGNNYHDVAYINFNTNASAQFDHNYDAYKLFGINDAPQVFATIPSTNINLSINVLDSIKSDLSIPIGFKVGVTGFYSLDFDNQTSFSPTVKMYLEDTKTSTITNLRNTQVYTFMADPADNPDRFKLDFYMPTISIDESTNNDAIIYSFNKQIFIEYKEKAENSKIKIYNLLGQIVKEIQINGNQSYIINASELSGNYIIQLISKKAIITKKINL